MRLLDLIHTRQFDHPALRRCFSPLLEFNLHYIGHDQLQGLDAYLQMCSTAFTNIPGYTADVSNTVVNAEPEKRKATVWVTLQICNSPYTHAEMVNEVCDSRTPSCTGTPR